MMFRTIVAVVALAFLDAGPTPGEALGPRPGDVYREYAVHNGGDRDWRVTDPDARAEGARRYLPNPVVTIAIDDLEHATRAEAVIDRWGGHIRTTAKRVRFNGGPWVDVAEIEATPGGDRAEYYYSQDNPTIAVRLDLLREGENTIEGTCRSLDGFDWGQWGLYSVIVRVYYDPAAKPHATGRVVAPADGARLFEDPTIRVEPIGGRAIERVDLVARYDGLDEDGDGDFLDWHEAYFQPARGEPAEIGGHLGTSTRSPHALTWETHWVPDQPPGSIRLLARVRGREGLWSVAPEVRGLSLVRPETSVRLYRTPDLPRSFGVRSGQAKRCAIPIEADGLDRAEEAVLAIRTWHGRDEAHAPLDLNGLELPIGGKNHHYDFDLIPVPVEGLRPGDNVLTIRSTTEHHMLEILLPGPALLVRTRR